METHHANSMPATIEGVAWLRFLLNPKRDCAPGTSTADLAASVIDELVTTFAQRVLASESPDELDWAIDVLLDDLRFGAAYQRLATIILDMQPEAASCSAPADNGAGWASCLGADSVPQLDRLMTYSNALLSAHLRSRAAAPNQGQRGEPRPLLEFLENLSLPVAAKRIQMDFLRAEVGLFAISAILRTALRQPAWMIKQLLGIAERGYYGQLRLMASLGNEIALELVPPEERIDVAGLKDAHNRCLLSTELLLLKHTESGQEVLSPFSEIALDDE